MREHIVSIDRELKGRLGLHNVLVRGTNLPTAVGRRASVGMYRIGQRLYSFS